MIFGNSDQRSYLLRLLNREDPRQTIVLTGPAHSGKFSWIQELVKETSADDTLVAEPGVESARDAVQFCSTDPIVSELRILFLPDLDKFTEPAQDAYLKLVEEPSPYCKVVATSSNFDGVLPALRSRFRTRLVWSRLSDDEMRQFAESEGVVDESALGLSDGLPGIYFRIAHQPKFRDLKIALESFVSGSPPSLLSPTPELLVKLDPKSEDRPVIAYMIRHVARRAELHVARHLFDFAAVIINVPSSNVEIYWMRTVARISSM